MNSSEYKTYHESFMRNNHGTTAFHTFFCIFFTVQCTLVCSLQKRKSNCLQYGVDYLVIVVPLILAHTLLSQYIYLLNIVAFTIVMFNIHSNSLYFKKINLPKNCDNLKLESISSMRGLTYLITGLCILAVDFEHFPRNLAKTERFGYSLMDTGVGLFVVMSGLVHKNLEKYNFKNVLRSNIKFISILFILGLGRYVSVKQLDYHEHVTEYGVHWNFFFTLAVCKLLSTVLLLLSNKVLFLSLVMLLLHELLLHHSWQDWVFSEIPRSNLVDANREGISSNLGYVSMYLFSVHLKRIINDKNRNLVLFKLTTLSASIIIMSYFINLIKPTSRTLANAGYCLFILSILLIILTVFYSIEICLCDKENILIYKTPLVLSAINNNGLIYFLICNLSTGFINIVFQTMLISPMTTIVILNIYMLFTITITVYLNQIGCKL
ncbi:phosphatidylinositol-glycan biosynthesis class W protein-like [Leptidea sinapis]|uniref:phosphatidylinositol-glycan biosynthesis class W protein-like n=1 Tax=Leptidea sinapis TaxID=189913 RepID=UPI002140ACF1|nr:phosphatidylinositol-glycan biosynthesis class W protein-like [Leptidea sinapis]